MHVGLRYDDFVLTADCFQFPTFSVIFWCSISILKFFMLVCRSRMQKVTRRPRQLCYAVIVTVVVVAPVGKW